MSAPLDWDSVVGSADDVRWVFNSSPTMSVAFRGRDHRIIAANATSRALFPKLGAIGQPVREAFPEVLGQYIFEMLDRVYETGEAQENREWRIELDLDGSGNLHEFFIDATVTARRNDAGEIDGIQALFQEVGDRVRARRAAEARAAEISQRFEQVRTSATVMQQALLASSVPVLPGCDVAAEYLVGAQDTAAGGDWFDAIATGDGALFLVVGDVVGHGVEAAATMAQLRTVTRQQVLSGRTVAETMDAVEAFSKHVRGARSATICIGRLDSDTGCFEYCTAGHPPPLLVTGGQPRYVKPSGGGPMGTGLPYVAATETLEIGDAVLLYTDGLIERPQRQFAESIAEFAEVAADILAGGGFLGGGTAQRPVDRLCSQALELLLRDGGYSDDVTLLAAQRTRSVSPLSMSVETDAQPTPQVRARLRDWLEALGAEPVDVIVVEHAVSEYVDNAVEHAYPGGSGSVTIEAMLDRDATLGISVVDRGQWRPPNPHRPGRGLSMAGALIEGARVIPGDEGTRAHMVYPLTRAARLVTDPMIGHAGRPAVRRIGFDVHIEPDGLMIVGGDIDALHAPLLAGRITGESHSGTVPLQIDLSLVTHLGSAAVRVIGDAHALAVTQGAPLTLIAPPGSTAHHILTIVGIPVTGG